MLVARQMGGEMTVKRFFIKYTALRLDDGDEFAAEIRVIEPRTSAA